MAARRVLDPEAFRRSWFIWTARCFDFGEVIDTGYVFEEWYGTYATLGTQNGNQITFNMFINGHMEARFTPQQPW